MTFDIDRLIDSIEHIRSVRSRQKRYPGASDANWQFDDEIRRMMANTMTVYEQDYLDAFRELKRLQEQR